MRISARDVLRGKAGGKVVGVERGAATAHVRPDVGGTIATAAITNEAVDELAMDAAAVVKASDVMVAVD